MRQSAKLTDGLPARRRAFRSFGLALVLLALALALPAGALAGTPAPPTIMGFSPDHGGVGTVVTLVGSGLRGATLVEFVHAPAHFAVLADNRMQLQVPAGAVSGPISVTTPGGTAVSARSFTMAPTISGFAPAGGPPGTLVTVNGNNLTGATSVTFNGRPASSFAVLTPKQLTATVPASATTGRIAVASAAGSATSSGSFTVTSAHAKTITAFSFQGLTPPATGVIDEAAHTIALTVPRATDWHALVATFTTTGAAVAVGDTPQVSGTTANDFSSPVTYRVTAGDTSTQDYTVTVTVVAPLAIGDAYGGGVIAYILQSGDPGYSATVPHGLIATRDDQPISSGVGIRWALPINQGTSVPGGTGIAIGTGAANTTRIIAQNGMTVTYAAGLAQACLDGGYRDWYLPSKDELNKLYINRAAVGRFFRTTYWSSSEIHEAAAWCQDFGTGIQAQSSKSSSIMRVHAVRSF